MANDRLYIVDRNTGEFMMIAKSFGEGWGNLQHEALAKFLANMGEDGQGEPTSLILGTEEDEEFWEMYINPGTFFKKETP